MAQRVGVERREELLDGVMGIVAVRGFSTVRVSDIAAQLRCSFATLYDIAPDKTGLVALAIGRWGELALGEAEARAGLAGSSAGRAREYILSGAQSLGGLSHAFRRDVERVEVTRAAYLVISDRFTARCADLIDQAAQVGEMRSVNARFLAGVLRHMAAAVRDEDLLDASGMTASEAVVLIEEILWLGLRGPHALPDAGPVVSTAGGGSQPVQ